MPVTTTFPGVYVQEVPSGVRTVTGVSTAVTAFVGYAAKGPVNQAVQIFDFGSFEREFGGIAGGSEIGYSVEQFFLNGGTEAWVVRVAAGAQRAAVTLMDPVGGKALVVTAATEGTWGNSVRLDVDYATTNCDSRFNLTVTGYEKQGDAWVSGQSETYRNLSMDQTSPDYSVDVVNAASKLIRLARHPDVTQAVLDKLPAGWSLSGDLKLFPNLEGGTLSDTSRSISIVVDGDGPYDVKLFPAGTQPPQDLDALVTNLQAAVVAINPGLPRFAKFTAARATAAGVKAATGTRVLLTSGGEGEHSSVRVLSSSNNDAAGLLKLGLSNGAREREAAADMRPSQTGTSSGDLAAVDLTGLQATDSIMVTVADGATVLGSGTVSLGSALPVTLDDLAAALEAALQNLGSIFRQTSVDRIGTRLRVTLPLALEQTNATVTFAAVSGGMGATIKLATESVVNVARYATGAGAARGSQADAAAGLDGDPPASAAQLLGKQVNKTGMYALEDADIFNILCIPRTAQWNDTEAYAAISAAIAYCTGKHAFLIVDPPQKAASPDDVQKFMAKLTPDNHAAIYFPAVRIPDVANRGRLVNVPPSGTIAGLYARSDTARGVWKAPAGTEATLANVQELAYNLTDAENGMLNPKGINCLRQFPVYGPVCWGARTLRGADQLSDDYKYVPVRRLALYIEESLYRGTQWVVFEPNDEPLWAQIRLNVGAFMHDLFRKGAFQGKTPQEAYFVKCDKETTTQNDINNGVVNIVVGFAPLKPAEFVIIQIQQMAGQISV